MTRLISTGVDGLNTLIVDQPDPASLAVDLRVEHRTTGIGVTVSLDPQAADDLLIWLQTDGAEHWIRPTRTTMNSATAYRVGGFLEVRAWPLGRREVRTYTVTLNRDQTRAVVAWLKGRTRERQQQ